ncbi:GntR family transcriptional regulator [Celeribacter sp.]|uniref:GntR family transcriptional regulator n=1 Tax=Celeribacter sp. TaxID=1890673 RepID=UPI003A8D59D1
MNEFNALGEGFHGDNLPEKIAYSLRRDILRGRLNPGDAIKERDNAEELGVSRTPMREAIRILAQEGLVILRRARSPIVAQPSFKTLADQVEVMLNLEKLSAEIACRAASEEEIEEVVELTDLMEDTFDQSDPLDMFELDMKFHAMIARMSHNETLADMHTSLLQRLWRARYLTAMEKRNRQRVITQHTAIIDALRARNPLQAAAAIQVHLGHLSEDLKDVMEHDAALKARAKSQGSDAETSE